MTEQPGPHEPAGRRATDRQANERQTAGRQGKGVDVLGDLQRWFIRQSAKNMRKEISGQVRRTFGGAPEHGDVWDTATNEIPPEVGESPECQWCPICRAARRMRDAGPGIGGQLSGAGDVVASAVQDAISALDSLLTKASGTGRDSAASGTRTPNGAPRDGAPPESASQDRARDDRPREDRPRDDRGQEDRPSSGHASGLDRHGRTSGVPEPDHGTAGPRPDRPELAGLPGGIGSDAGETERRGSARVNGSGTAGEPADRLAAAPGTEPDPWGPATETAEASQDTNVDAQSDGPGSQSGWPGNASGRPGNASGGPGNASGGPGHGPDDRG